MAYFTILSSHITQGVWEINVTDGLCSMHERKELHLYGLRILKGSFFNNGQLHRHEIPCLKLTTFYLQEYIRRLIMRVCARAHERYVSQ